MRCVASWSSPGWTVLQSPAIPYSSSVRHRFQSKGSKSSHCKIRMIEELQAKVKYQTCSASINLGLPADSSKQISRGTGDGYSSVSLCRNSEAGYRLALLDHSGTCVVSSLMWPSI